MIEVTNSTKTAKILSPYFNASLIFPYDIDDMTKIAMACHNRHLQFHGCTWGNPFKRLYLVTSSIDIRMTQKTNDSANAYNKH